MDLEYKLLWADDDKGWMDSIEDTICEAIRNYGFQSSIKRISTNEKGLNYKDFDLILMDYKLINSTGDKIITEIRRLNILTDVVFYSADGRKTLKELVRDLDLEGVYYADRRGFARKVKQVIESTIKKVQDINNLRGLVMAEVSELDGQMDDILKAYYTTDERMKLLRESVIIDREKTLRKELLCKAKDCTLKWHDKSIEVIVDKFDSSQKAHAIHILLKNIDPHNEVFNLPNFMSEYDESVIKVRNQLAHCQSEVINGEEILKTRVGDVIYDGGKFKKVRQDISHYHNIFNKILSYLENDKDNIC